MANYTPLRTLEEEDLEEDDLDLGPIRKGHYKKSQTNRYQDLFHHYDIEATPESRNRSETTKRSLLFVLSMAIVLVILVISAAVYVSSGPAPAPTSHINDPLGISNSIPKDAENKRAVSLDDVLSGKFYARPWNGTWISDSEVRYFNENGDLIIYNVVTKVKSAIVSGQDISLHLDGKPPVKCLISADRNFVLFSYDAQKIFRHSSYSKYIIYDILARQFSPLVPTVLTKKHKLLQLAHWGPVGNALVFVYANNIYYKASALDLDSLQITTDGNQLVYNGVTDWVYEEEVFASDTAIWFSPDGSNLAFVSFNDSQVDEIHFEIYGEPGSLGFQYPLIESIPYPKAGRTNPTAQVSMVALRGLQEGQKFHIKRDIQFPDVPFEHYVAGLVWASNHEIVVVTLNRHQNDSRHHLCTIQNQCQTLLVDQQRNGWIDVEIPVVSSDGKSFITITSQFQGEKWYRHILKYTRDSLKKPMTDGDFSVDSIVRWDAASNRIYFLAPFYDFKTRQLVPSTSHLYYVEDTELPAGAPKLACVTCEMATSFNEPCLTNSIELSKGASYFVQSCTGPNPPQVFVRSMMSREDNTLWQANVELRTEMRSISQPIVKNFDIPIANNLTLKARLQVPPTLDPTKKYPLLIDVYAGPNSQKNTDAFGVDWSDTLITSKEVIYASIDGRGSGRQSDDLKFQIYRRLGTVEVDDQIFGAAWLTANVPYIDPNRTAIWGWSYGGFTTAMAMGKDLKGVFKCGISVAPVTNWAFYDTIYTERHMGLPVTNDNFIAYNNSDATNYIENFRNKKFYLIHGTADDNVHYQQSMVLARALEKADILFRQTSYPDENHGLGSVRRHLYHSLDDFLFTQCF